ncbi:MULTISPECIES: EexN family lipoprotein [Agrobacterium]|uniref:EexN family lipoprotein n=1 Tax=Agrobacterium larrymoorei TaxID=160699 RepID=A0ABX8TC86_9HYPH|nr:EexN family lipoprotein [Agrobacterium larrymoorei]NSZ10056.1 EexN family lipoprotein [Agrobacterium tumefaciens]QYA10858.1 EexN family lipoprotein [Agrobacterium larrymoorei]
MKLKLIMLGLAAMTISACSSEAEKAPEPEQKVEVRDVQFYVSNNAEREQTLTECEANPGTLADTPNCINATEANKQVRRQQMRDAINKG